MNIPHAAQVHVRQSLPLFWRLLQSILQMRFVAAELQRGASRGVLSRGLADARVGDVGAGRNGGGMACVGNADPYVPSNAIVNDCTFTNNQANEDGGGFAVVLVTGGLAAWGGAKGSLRPPPHGFCCHFCR